VNPRPLRSVVRASRADDGGIDATEREAGLGPGDRRHRRRDVADRGTRAGRRQLAHTGVADRVAISVTVTVGVAIRAVTVGGCAVTVTLIP